MIRSQATRRQFMRFTAAAGLTVLGGGSVGCTEAARTKAQGGAPPNVLFVAVDDLRHDCGCWGHPLVRTPHIDRLAAGGMRFDRSYCQHTICNPSRSSFLTGLRPGTTGVHDNRTPLRSQLPDVITMPQQFRKNGYRTVRLGKIFHGGMDDEGAWDVSTDFRPTPLGHNKGEGRNLTGGTLRWCTWRAAEGADEDQPDGQIAAEAIRQLQAHRDRPFFLAVGFHKPHDPFIAPKSYFEPYPLDRITLPPEAPASAEPAPGPTRGGGFARAFDAFTDRERLEFTRAYYACTTFMDAQLGKVLAALERLGLAERTVVVFLSDHGYHLGERNWWNKNTLFEHACRSPLLIRAPGITTPGRPTRCLVEFVDLFPTLADLCGVSPPQGLQGCSLVPLLRDADHAVKAAAFTEVSRGQFMGYSVRTDRWRYTEWEGGKRGAELYDHEDDPNEWHNRAADPAWAGVRADLSKRLGAYARVGGRA